MKILLSLIILLFPISIFAKQICIAPSGCAIEMDTGFCPKCINVKDEPIIKEEKVIVEKKPVVNESTAPKVSNTTLYPRVNESLGKTKKKKGVCYVEPCDWLKTSSNKKTKTRKKNWVGMLWKCIVGCKEGVSYWDDGGNEFDENLNLVLN